MHCRSNSNSGAKVYNVGGSRSNDVIMCSEDAIYRLYKLGLTTSSYPAKIFKLWAIWQNEKDIVLTESQTSQQGATTVI